MDLGNSYSDKRVIFFVPYGSWLVHNQVDAVLATALRQRGADVLLLACDGLFQEKCYVLTHSSQPEQDCKNCTLSGQSFFNFFQLPLLQTRDLISPGDLEEANQWVSSLADEELVSARFGSLEVGEWVRPSVRSFYVVNPRSLNLPEVVHLYRIYLVLFAGDVSSCRARVLRLINLRTAFCTMVLDLFTPLFFHAARKRGVEVLTHERGSPANSFTFSHNEKAASWKAINVVVKAWEKLPLSSQEFDLTKELLLDWEYGKNRIAGNFYDFSSNESELKARLNIPADRRILSVFTSSEHELVTETDRQIGGQQLSILARLIEIFSEREDYLVIRHHPNAGVTVRKRMDYDYLTRAYLQSSNLPNNVRIIMPNEKITSYSLVWNSHACISFISTIGIEAIAPWSPLCVL